MSELSSRETEFVRRLNWILRANRITHAQLAKWAGYSSEYARRLLTERARKLGSEEIAAWCAGLADARMNDVADTIATLHAVVFFGRDLAARSKASVGSGADAMSAQSNFMREAGELSVAAASAMSDGSVSGEELDRILRESQDARRAASEVEATAKSMRR